MRTAILLLLALPLSAAPAPGEEVLLGKRYAIGFKLKEMRYVLAETGVSLSATPNADEQLLLVLFDVTNRSPQPLQIAHSVLRFRAIDATHRSHEHVSPIKLDGSGQPAAKVILEPGQGRALYVTLRVPRTGVDTLVVRRALSPAYELRFAVIRKVGGDIPKLPPKARYGDAMPLRTIDVAVEGEPKLLPHKTRKDRQLLAFPVYLQNRSDSPRAVRGLLAGSVVKDSENRAYPIHDPLLEDVLKARGSWRGFVLFDVPADKTLETLQLVQFKSLPVSYALPAKIGRAADTRGVARTRRAKDGATALGVFNPRDTASKGRKPSPLGGKPGKNPDRRKRVRVKDKKPPREPRSKPDEEGKNNENENGSGKKESTDAGAVVMHRRTGVIDLRKLTIERTSRPRGHSPFLMVHRMRGRLQDNINPLYRFDLNKDTLRIDPDNGWAKRGEKRDIPLRIGQREFPNLRAYEIFGIVAILCDQDAGPNRTQREQAARDVQRTLHDRWKRFLAMEGTFDYRRKDGAYANNLARTLMKKLKKNFLSGLREEVLRQVQDAFGRRNKKTVIEVVPVFWINRPDAPSLTDKGILEFVGLSRGTLDRDHFVEGTALETGMLPPRTLSWLDCGIGWSIRKKKDIAFSGKLEIELSWK